MSHEEVFALFSIKLKQKIHHSLNINFKNDQRKTPFEIKDWRGPGLALASVDWQLNWVCTGQNFDGSANLITDMDETGSIGFKLLGFYAWLFVSGGDWPRPRSLFDYLMIYQDEPYSHPIDYESNALPAEPAEWFSNWTNSTWFNLVYCIPNMD